MASKRDDWGGIDRTVSEERMSTTMPLPITEEQFDALVERIRDNLFPKRPRVEISIPLEAYEKDPGKALDMAASATVLVIDKSGTVLMTITR